jgi:transcription antitermination factor NusG
MTMNCDSSLKLWYAAYTCANHEKRVAQQLAVRSVEHFLPLYESVRRWKDRRVQLQLPLFPGYVFVRLALRDRLQVLEIPSVARLVGFNGTPTPLPDGEIEALKAGLAGGVRAVPHPYLKVGRRVRITSGPFEGHEGVLIRKKNKLRFVISLDMIQRSIRLDIDTASVEPVNDRQAWGNRHSVSWARRYPPPASQHWNRPKRRQEKIGEGETIANDGEA